MNVLAQKFWFTTMYTLSHSKVVSQAKPHSALFGGGRSTILKVPFLFRAYWFLYLSHSPRSAFTYCACASATTLHWQGAESH